MKIKGLNDTVDVIDGYYLKTKPVNLGTVMVTVKDWKKQPGIWSDTELHMVSPDVNS